MTIIKLLGLRGIKQIEMTNNLDEYLDEELQIKDDGSLFKENPRYNLCGSIL